jgi:hypothetical protein
MRLIDLEEYLLAVYKNVLNYKDSKATVELILKILQDSFTTESYSFDNTWLKIVKPPESNNKELFISNGIAYTLEVLKFQIAELHKMRGKQLDDKYRYFGVQSEAGNSWYNFDPIGNLECGARCLCDGNSSIEIIDWSFIGILLEMGRIYE